MPRRAARDNNHARIAAHRGPQARNGGSAAAPAPRHRRGDRLHQGRRAQPHRRLGLARHGLCQAQDAAGDRRRSLWQGCDAVGAGVSGLVPGQLVSIYGARTCGLCRPCREGRDNLCEHVSGVHGFHLDGFAQEQVNLPARLLVPAPPGVSAIGAAVAPVTFGTVEHMLFDNARLEPGETILIHAGGSGIGTAAIQLAKKIGCTVITTVGSDAKIEKAKALGADHVINYREDRFEGVVRKLTKKRALMSSSSMSAPTPGRVPCCRSSAAAGWSPADRPQASPPR
jgi:hypothetical protein